MHGTWNLQNSTELVSMVDDIVSGGVEISKAVIGIGVQLMELMEHCECLEATVVTDVIDRNSTPTEISGHVEECGQCTGEAALSSDPGNNEIPRMSLMVQCLT